MMTCCVATLSFVNRFSSSYSQGFTLVYSVRLAIHLRGLGPFFTNKDVSLLRLPPNSSAAAGFTSRPYLTQPDGIHG